MNELKEFFEANREKLTDKSELIVIKPTKKGNDLNFRIIGKKDIEDYYKDITPTEKQIKEFYKEHGKELEAMGESEPLVYIPLIEDEKIGFTLWGYESEKDVPNEIRFTQEYHLFCLHYKKPKDEKTLELFLKYRIANTENKDLYWFEYKLFLKEKFNSDLPKTNEAIRLKTEKESIEKIQKALNYLAYIKEYMPENEFPILCEYVKHIITTNELPLKMEKITIPVIKNYKDKQGTVYLFSKLNKCTSVKKDIWIQFLFTAFKDMDLEHTTVEQKFTTEGKYITKKLFTSQS